VVFIPSLAELFEGVRASEEESHAMAVLNQVPQMVEQVANSLLVGIELETLKFVEADQDALGSAMRRGPLGLLRPAILSVQREFVKKGRELSALDFRFCRWGRSVMVVWVSPRFGLARRFSSKEESRGGDQSTDVFRSGRRDCFSGCTDGPEFLGSAELRGC
jgi:hypothetical protein